MRRIAAGIICIVTVVFQMPAEAEGPVTLGEAVGIALQNNNEIKAKGYALESSHKERQIAMSHLLPTIAVEERFSRTNNPTYAFMAKLNQERFDAADFGIDRLNNPDAISNFQTMVSFEQAVFAKKASVGLDMAGTAVETSRLDLRSSRDSVGFHVFQAYVNILVAKEYERVAGNGLEDAREHLRVAEVRYQAGLGLYSDVLRAQVAVAEADKSLIEAQKNVKVAQRMLGLLMGRDGPVDTVQEVFPVLPLSPLSDYLEHSGARADLKAMETRYLNAGKAVKLAEAEYYPIIGIGGSYELDDHETPFGSEGTSWQVMAFLRVQLFDGFGRESRRAKAVHQRQEAGEYLEGMKKRIAFEVHEAFYTVEEVSKKRDLADAALVSAEEGMRLMNKRYESGLAPLVALLDAQTALDRARADAIAMQGQHTIAVARLEYASGRLLASLGVGE